MLKLVIVILKLFYAILQLITILYRLTERE
jgi:hypothetical protein